MPLSRPTKRKLLHMRDITLRGYVREDGCVDIEARMTDVKSYSFGNRDRGVIAAGEPLHDMWIRMTVTPDLLITDCEASLDSGPYNICGDVTPNMQRLVGLRIGKGFLSAAMQRVRGPEGCTHLRELLQPVATVAMQTMIGAGKTGSTAELDEQEGHFDARFTNTCYSYAEDGPVVTRAKEMAANLSPELPVTGLK